MSISYIYHRAHLVTHLLLCSPSPRIPPPFPSPEGRRTFLHPPTGTHSSTLINPALSFLCNHPQHAADTLLRTDNPLDLPIEAYVGRHCENLGSAIAHKN